MKKLSKIKLQTYNQSKHGICTDKISPSAQAIITKLIEHNFQAYIVGGAVRDLLIGKNPKDFDIATNATPEQIKCIFKRECRIIGRRFRLAHVYHNREMYEVATFRGTHKHKDSVVKKGQIVKDNVFGTIEQDAVRRDFTCNALYLDIQNANILDYCDGYQDILKKQLKFIGDDRIRIIEDPIRMIRAIRFQAKLGLQMSDQLKSGLHLEFKTIGNVSPARLFDELVKLFHCGNAQESYVLMKKFGLFQFIFPKMYPAIDRDEKNNSFVQSALKSTDLRISQGKSTTPIFLFACFLWPLTRKKIDELIHKNTPQYDAINQAANDVFVYARSQLAIPKVIQIGIRHIWLLQFRFSQMKGKKVYSTLDHPRFRAAYDFLLLRKLENENISEMIDWWTEIQELSPPKQKELIFPLRAKKKKLSAKSHTCYLGLGSNIGDAEQNILTSIDHLKASKFIKVIEVASNYLTKPWGNKNQDDFVNSAVKISTQLKPGDLLDELKSIERLMGRAKVQKWGPRIIDIDILLYGNNVVKQQQLIIPHPYITERDFVIVPLLELNSALIIPKKGKLVNYRPKELKKSGIIQKHGGK